MTEEENGTKEENEEKERMKMYIWVANEQVACKGFIRVGRSIFSYIPDVLCAVRAPNCWSSNRDTFC
jgi:hypothetical protein